MKNLLILLIAFMVFSCSNEVSGVEQEPAFEVYDSCDFVKHYHQPQGIQLQKISLTSQWKNWIQPKHL